MRIAVTCALSWPFIRRGNRFSYDLAVWLASRGNEVDFICPGPARWVQNFQRDGLTVVYLPLPESLLLTALKIQKLGTFAKRCAQALDEGHYDLVQSTYPIDAYAACLHKRRRHTPYVHTLTDCIPWWPAVRGGRRMFEEGIRHADRLVAVSGFVAQELQKDYDWKPEVIPPSMELDQFPLGGAKPPDQARILCTASLTDPRKRVALLVAAFAELKKRVPHAELLLSGQSDDQTNARLLCSVPPEIRAAIHVHGVGRRADLPKVYRKASLSVLPSLREAFGLVITESLASGTPVVATKSGAAPEILNDPRVGILFDPKASPKEVAAALRRGLALARDPQTPARCRRHVEKRYPSQVIGPRYLGLYEQVMGPRASACLSRAGHATKALSPPRSPSGPPAPDNIKGWRHVFEEALSQRAPASSWFQIETERPGALAVARRLTRQVPDGGTCLLWGKVSLALELLLGHVGWQISRLKVLPGPKNPDNQKFQGVVALVQDRRQAELEDLAGALAPLVAPRGMAIFLCPKGSGLEAGLRQALRRADFQVVESRPTMMRLPLTRSWNSTPLKSWLARVPLYTLRALVPPLCQNRLLAATKRRTIVPHSHA